jgi:crotonobetainyl-CoA:carnitine CoA-transferase CaiB-like acyl-CoA transferase
MMGALFHRERTGEATVVDVSLLGTGMWAQGQAIGLSLVLGQGWVLPAGGAIRNPLVKNYLTKDGKWLAINCLQGFFYWAPLCEILGRPDLITDERFATHETLMENAPAAAEILAEVFADATVDEWRARLQDFVGQWTVVQDTLEAARDQQSVANGYLQPAVTAEGNEFELVAAPVQFDEEPARPGRAPEFNEHGDAILEELGLDWDTVVDLKVRGVVA